MVSRYDKQKARKAIRTERRRVARLEAEAKAKAGRTQKEIDQSIRYQQRDYKSVARRGHRKWERKKAAWRSRLNRRLAWRNLGIVNRSGLRPLPWEVG